MSTPDTEAIRQKMFAAKGGAVFVIVRDGHVLMERCPKKAAMFGGVWFIPGGKIEEEETAEAACVREAWEEMGVRIKSVTPLPVLDGAPAGWPYFPLHPFVVLTYSGVIPGGALDAPVQFAWIPVSEAVRSPVSQVRRMVASALRAIAPPNHLPSVATPEPEQSTAPPSVE